MSEAQATVTPKKGLLTKRNIAIIVVVIFVLMIWAGSSGGSLAGAKTATVEVVTTSSWSGALMNGYASSVTWSGSGNYAKTLDRPSNQNTWIISVNAQKQDSGLGTLTLRIKDSSGKILAEQSTSSAYGVVQIGATIP